LIGLFYNTFRDYKETDRIIEDQRNKIEKLKKFDLLFQKIILNNWIIHLEIIRNLNKSDIDQIIMIEMNSFIKKTIDRIRIKQELLFLPMENVLESDCYALQYFFFVLSFKFLYNLDDDDDLQN
jgi:hypothetical protein